MSKSSNDSEIELVKNIILPLTVITSIGLSDTIEYYLSPFVHKVHNCPDIMKMDFKNYNGYYAFLSGVKCSWFLIFPLCLFKHSIPIITGLNIINLLIPVICYFCGVNKRDIYFGHKMLYLVNPILLGASIIKNL